MRKDKEPKSQEPKDVMNEYKIKYYKGLLEGQKYGMSDYRRNLELQKYDLEKDIADDRKRRSEIYIKIIFLIMAGVVSAILGIILNRIEIDKLIISYIVGGLSYVFLIFGIILFTLGLISMIVTYSITNSTIVQLEEQKTALTNEIELIDIAAQDHELRAEVQFKNHQRELKRYYDVNLKQFKMVFPLGIVTVIMGIAIICFSIILFKDTATENIFPTLIGSISGILVDFVGVIFIRMYKETMSATTEFHNKLIQSNNNLFANVLINKISDEDVKNETVAEIAKALSINNTDNKKDSKEDNEKDNK